MRFVGGEKGFALAVGDLAGRGDFVSCPHPGVFFCFLEVLLVEEFVEGLIVFACVFRLEGAKRHVRVDFWLFGICGGGCDRGDGHGRVALPGFWGLLPSPV